MLALANHVNNTGNTEKSATETKKVLKTSLSEKVECEPPRRNLSQSMDLDQIQ